MQLWRGLAYTLGSGLMLGEAWRSWGAGRHWLFVVDDFVIGIPLVVTAALVGRPTLARRCAFSAAYAGAAGMLYGSFFGKLVEPAATNTGNWSLGWLTLLVGLAFAGSLAGLVGSILARGENLEE